MGLTKKQIILIVSAAIVAVILFIAPKKALVSQEVKTEMAFESRIDSAVALVESGNAPMKGIFQLKGLLEESPENTKILLHLGVFAVQSGQYDKALERFNKVLEINPDLAETYYYMGHTFANKNDHLQAITYFEKYKTLIDDKNAIKEVESIISNLKKT